MWGNPTLFHPAKSIVKVSRKDKYWQKVLKKILRKDKCWQNQPSKAFY